MQFRKCASSCRRDIIARMARVTRKTFPRAQPDISVLRFRLLDNTIRLQCYNALTVQHYVVGIPSKIYTSRLSFTKIKKKIGILIIICVYTYVSQKHTSRYQIINFRSRQTLFYNNMTVIDVRCPDTIRRRRRRRSS